MAQRASVQQALLDLAATPEGASMLAGVPVLRMVATSIEDYKIVETLGIEAFFMTD